MILIVTASLNTYCTCFITKFLFMFYFLKFLFGHVKFHRLTPWLAHINIIIFCWLVFSCLATLIIPFSGVWYYTCYFAKSHN